MKILTPEQKIHNVFSLTAAHFAMVSSLLEVIAESECFNEPYGFICLFKVDQEVDKTRDCLKLWSEVKSEYIKHQRSHREIEDLTNNVKAMIGMLHNHWYNEDFNHLKCISDIFWVIDDIYDSWPVPLSYQGYGLGDLETAH